jgi:acetylserotonin N-methyltransferase
MTSSGAPVVLELIQAFRRSKTLFTTVRLGIFDRLAQAPASAATLAAELGLNQSALERLLDGCAGMGLLARQNGLYSNQPDTEPYLLRSSPQSLAGYILYSDDALFPMWNRLADAVREGTPRWRQVHGVEGSIFDGFYRTPEARAEFLAGMHGLGLLASPSIVRAFDLSPFRRLADLGGGTGHLAIAACEHYPHLEAVVFDLPQAVASAQPYLAASPAAARLSAQSGDFFRDPLPHADLYSLGRILHDWPESRIQPLLSKIHTALPPAGGILIVEALLDDDGLGPVPALMQALNMLVSTEGRERTTAGYAALLQAAGFTVIQSFRTGAPLDAVFACKPA